MWAFALVVAFASTAAPLNGFAALPDPREHAGHSDPPDVQGAAPSQRAQAQSLLDRSKQVAAAKFPTVAAAFDLGYVRPSGAGWPPIFHLHNCASWFDGHTLDPERPEALVYWNPGSGVSPVLVAFLFRQSAYRPSPAFGAPIVRWHAHLPTAATQMTHAWFTNRLESAFAREPPLPELSYLLAQAAPTQASPIPPRPVPTPRIRYSGGTCFGRGAGVETVRVRTESFARKTLSIPVGSKVVWKWTGKSRHYIVGAGAERFRSALKRSGTFGHRFTWIGRTRITSSSRPGMRMTVRVHR